MACGDRYSALLVSSNGTTADAPCNLYCGFGDYERWRDRARELSVLVSEHWRTLARLEDSAGTNVHRQGLVEQQHNLVEDYERLPTAAQAMFELGELTWEGAVGRAVAVCRSAVCLLEQVDDAIATYGVPAPPIPLPTKPAPPWKPFSMGSMLLPALVIGGAVAFVVLKK